MGIFHGKFSGLLKLMRPLEWSKTLGNMAIGSVAALYVMYNGAVVGNFNLVLFIAGFFSAGFFLWSGLYMLNDWTDRERDSLHDVKKKRPIPSGRVNPRIAFLAAVVLIAAAFVVGFAINTLFVICLLAMLINQLLYTLDPISLKKKPVLDLISGSLVNPLFRFYGGWVLFLPAFNAPILLLVFILGFQLGGFALYRLSSAEHERELGYKSSVVVFGERNLRHVAYLGIALAGLAFLAMPFLGIVPLETLWLILLGLAAIPVFKSAMKKPHEMDMEKTYRQVYVLYLIFIAGFVAVFLI